MSQIIIDTNDDVKTLRVLSLAVSQLADLQEGSDAAPKRERPTGTVPELAAPFDNSEVTVTVERPKSTAPESTDSTPAAEPSTAPVDAAANTAPPATPASPASPAGAAVEFDVNGLPWDHRIHSGARSKNADNSWKRLRNTKATGRSNEEWTAYIAEVEAELRSIPKPASAPTASAPAPTLAARPATPAEPTAATVMAPASSTETLAAAPALAPNAPNSMVPPVAAAASPTTTTPTAPAALTYADFMKAVVTSPELMSHAPVACTQAGIPSLPALGARLDLVPQVAAQLAALVPTHAHLLVPAAQA